MATIFYIRASSKQGNITSSREVSVADLINLYGAAPSNYQYMKGAESPAIKAGQGQSPADSDPTHVIVKIESNEAGKDPFPEQGFYGVNDVKS